MEESNFRKNERHINTKNQQIQECKLFKSLHSNSPRFKIKNPTGSLVFLFSWRVITYS